MYPVDIYCFSGTGNTLLVARAMRDRFVERGIDAAVRRLEACDPGEVDLSHVTGIACPVAAQSTYPLVWDFVRGLPASDGSGAFLVDTLAAFSGGIVGPMRRVLAGKGYAPLGASEVRMPSNFLRRRADAAGDARRIVAGVEAARGYADALAEGKARWRGMRPWEPVFRLGEVFSYGRLKLLGRLVRFSVDETKCVACGLCERLCPMGAISRSGARGFPEFSPACIACMRCFSYCPTGAIKIRGKDYVRHRPVEAADLLGQDAGGGAGTGG